MLPALNLLVDLLIMGLLVVFIKTSVLILCINCSSGFIIFITDLALVDGIFPPKFEAPVFDLLYGEIVLILLFVPP